jgi:hypothetical protein
MTPPGRPLGGEFRAWGLQKANLWRAKGFKIAPKKKNRITAAFD